MRTKMLTAGSLAGAQEFIASWLAKDRNKDGHYFTSRVPKMAAYGAFVSAPLGSLLIWLLQKVFKGRTSLRAKILQILVSNLVVRPGLCRSLSSFRDIDGRLTWTCRSRPSRMRCISAPWLSSPARGRTTRCGRRFASGSGRSCGSAGLRRPCAWPSRRNSCPRVHGSLSSTWCPSSSARTSTPSPRRRGLPRSARSTSVTTVAQTRGR